VVYSTCALAPLENDDVVKKILKKRPSMRLETIAEIPAGADRTECGVHILPDRAEGRGPIYCARLVKE
jgi:16S rRNA C967 or C1407 C5-methylase (RsmB/RsmF family)